MSKLVHLAREYFNEGDLRDLLSNHKITANVIAQVCRERKVFFAPKAKREKVCNNLARMFLDWNEFVSITEKLNTPRKTSRSRPMRFPGKLTHAVLNDAIEHLGEARGKESGEQYVVKKSGNKLRVETTYVSIDPSRARYLKREEINTAIEIQEHEDGASSIYYEDDKRAKIICEALIGSAMVTHQDLEDKAVEKVDVSHLLTNGITDFFIKLIENLNDTTLETVTRVKLERPEEEDSEFDKEESPDETMVRNQLQKAHLHGEGILETSFYQSLTKENYFISCIRWILSDNKSNKQVMVEAGLRTPKEGIDFYTDIVGVFESEKDGAYSSTSRQPFKSETDKYTALISQLAFKLAKK